MDEENYEDITSLEAIEESTIIAMLTGRSSRAYYNFSFITTRIVRFYA